jgi:hypothetical protein
MEKADPRQRGGLSVLPPLPDAAIALDFSDVDKSNVIAGAVTAANLPEAAINFRRSDSVASSLFCLNLRLSALSHARVEIGHASASLA